VTEGAQYLPGGGEAGGKRVDKGVMVGPYVETIIRSVSNKYLDDEIGGRKDMIHCKRREIVCMT